jgi:hypothetical protein
MLICGIVSGLRVEYVGKKYIEDVGGKYEEEEEEEEERRRRRRRNINSGPVVRTVR